MKKYNPEDGVPVDTIMLSVATLMHGKVVLLGDLRDNTPKVRDDLLSTMREQTTPGQPMHLVEVKVVARILQTTYDEKTQSLA